MMAEANGEEFDVESYIEKARPNNSLLDDVIEHYDCSDLIPLANRIIWLATLKEVLGSIPNDMVPVDYEEMCLLVVLHEEQNKKVSHDSLKMRKEAEHKSSNSKVGGIENAVIES